MSRTIRRTKNKKHHSLFEKKYTYNRPEQWLDVKEGFRRIWPDWGYGEGYPLLKRQGKEFWQAWHWYHSDNFNDYAALTRFEGYKESAREQNKRELVKWLKNEDYEPVLLEHIDNHRYYDYW